MKKIIILAIFAFGFGMNVNAQSDGFFTSNYNEYRETTDEMGNMPSLFGHGLNTNQDAPIGSGLLLLASMGLAYGLKRRNEE